MMINIDAIKRMCNFYFFSAEDQTPQTTISSYENFVWESIFVNRGLGKTGLQVDLLTRARVCGRRARVSGGEAGAKQTKGRRDKGKKGQRDEGETRQRDDSTKGRPTRRSRRRDNRKKRPRDEGKARQRNDGTKGRQTRRRRDEGTKDDGTTHETGNRQKLDGT